MEASKETEFEITLIVIILCGKVLRLFVVMPFLYK